MENYLPETSIFLDKNIQKNWNDTFIHKHLNWFKKSIIWNRRINSNKNEPMKNV